MAAPTSVSSLLHSSTLITAGVYLIIRFNRIIIKNKLNLFLLFIPIFTIIMSGVNAIYKNDPKKIIALSILRQLGLIIIILNIGFNLLGFYRLITHAMFKFLRAGIIIHLMKNRNLLRKSGKVTILDEKNEEKIDTCNHQREKKRRKLNTNLSFQ